MVDIVGIYKITNKINGKVYIGQSVNIEHRWKVHLSRYRTGRNSHTRLYKAMKKHGIENFIFEIICQCSENELDELEIFYIKKYDSYLHGYNGTLGGGGMHVRNKTFSDETREKLREKALNMSEEHKLKNSISKRGSKNPMAKKIICDGKTFNTCKECADYYGVNCSTFNHWLRGVTRMPDKFKKLGLRYYNC